eukprot:CAMPEP_0183382424 /NCGR_PEP_ID=MMETSP0164_2-20130417/126900_1 /TAXON_ID=221442 /ORGANISM="Coccolithus pelagicus ssp braarudi, Strain PLY182g" /LENGTH=47 /DNA_ID= /DNA_START= /DNA_END= /DNA_ORIENTATION=
MPRVDRASAACHADASRSRSAAAAILTKRAASTRAALRARWNHFRCE